MEGSPLPERRLIRRRLTSADDVAAIEESFAPADLRPADTILQCLEAVARESPDKPAIVLVEPPDFMVPRRVISYRELVGEVAESASLFSDIAEGATSSVAVMLPMVPEGLSLLWGAQTAGVAVPINPFLELTALARIMIQVDATVLVTSRAILEPKGGADALAARVPTLRRVLYLDDPDPSTDLGTALKEHVGSGLAFGLDVDPRRDAMIMPTGGTTGTPKLVRMSQDGQLTVAWNVGALMGNEPDTVTAHGMPNFHCGGTISLGLRTLLFGGTLLTLTSVGFRSREAVGAFWDIARRYRVTSLLATPTTALALLHGSGTSEGCPIRDFHVGGSPLPIDLVDRFHERFGIWLRENWGMTELHGTTTGHYNDGRRPKVGSAGRVLPFVRVKAVELDSSGAWVRDCAPGERGVLLTATPTVMSGYVDENLDAGYFPRNVPSDLPADWRWGNTGDLGTVDEDGYVWVFGRTKDVIIRGGHNIDPREIEDALSSHPAVQLAAAVGRPDRAKGELPVAYVQLREGADAHPSELLAFCRERVQEKAAAPTEVLVMDQIPTTPVGKVSKPALRADALVREVAAVARGVVEDVHVELDDRGPRLVAIVTMTGSAEQASEVEARLAGYEFGARVRLAQDVAP